MQTIQNKKYLTTFTGKKSDKDRQIIDQSHICQIYTSYQTIAHKPWLEDSVLPIPF